MPKGGEGEAKKGRRNYEGEAGRKEPGHEGRLGRKVSPPSLPRIDASLPPPPAISRHRDVADGVLIGKSRAGEKGWLLAAD